MDRKDLVTILTVQNPTTAEIVRAALQAAGIPCEVGGETQAGFAGVLSIDVMTQAGDVKRARKHLRQLRKDIKVRKKRRAEAKQAKADEAMKLKDAIQELPKPSTEIQPPPETPME